MVETPKIYKTYKTYWINRRAWQHTSAKWHQRLRQIVTWLSQIWKSCTNRQKPFSKRHQDNSCAALSHFTISFDSVEGYTLFQSYKENLWHGSNEVTCPGPSGNIAIILLLIWLHFFRLFAHPAQLDPGWSCKLAVAKLLFSNLFPHIHMFRSISKARWKAIES